MPIVLVAFQIAAPTAGISGHIPAL